MKKLFCQIVLLFLLTSCATSYETRQSMRTLKAQDKAQGEEDEVSRRNGSQGNREQGDYNRFINERAL